MKERTIKSCESCGYSLRETTIEAIAVIETTCTCPNCGEKAKHFLFTEQRNLPDDTPRHWNDEICKDLHCGAIDLLKELPADERHKLINGEWNSSDKSTNFIMSTGHKEPVKLDSSERRFMVEEIDEDVHNG